MLARLRLRLLRLHRAVSHMFREAARHGGRALFERVPEPCPERTAHTHTHGRKQHNKIVPARKTKEGVAETLFVFCLHVCVAGHHERFVFLVSRESRE